MEAFIIKLFIQAHCNLIIFVAMSTFFNPPFPESVQVVSCLIFPAFEFHEIFLYVLHISIISLGTGSSWAKNTTFDNDKVLKIIIFPSKLRFLNHQIIKALSESGRAF